MNASRPSSSNRIRAAVRLLPIAAVLLVGCASTAPVVYQRPAVKPDTAQTARIARDTRTCRDEAVRSVGLNARGARQVGRDAGKAGAIGFAGAAAGSVVAGSREVWQRARTAAAAGAAGMAAKVLLDWNEPDEVHREYVEQCLQDRGHRVLGWR